MLVARAALPLKPEEALLATDPTFRCALATLLWAKAVLLGFRVAEELWRVAMLLLAVLAVPQQQGRLLSRVGRRPHPHQAPLPSNRAILHLPRVECVFQSVQARLRKAASFQSWLVPAHWEAR
jgi:hypothetical protein